MLPPDEIRHFEYRIEVANSEGVDFAGHVTFTNMEAIRERYELGDATDDEIDELYLFASIRAIDDHIKREHKPFGVCMINLIERDENVAVAEFAYSYQD